MKVIEKEIKLKNPLAQKLLKQRKIVIDEIEINLWTGHSVNSFDLHKSWNKIKSYTQLNLRSEGANGTVVLTGVMQIPRAEIAEYAVCLGFKVHSNISKKTNFLVIGTENVSPSKVAHVIELNKAGANIQFVDEFSFLQIISENFDIVSLGLHKEEEIESLEKEIKSKTFNSKKNAAAFMNQKDVKEIDNIFQGKSFVVSGKFTKDRDEIKKLITQYGGKNVSAISTKTDFVLAGDNMGPAKLKKAESLQISVISEADFYEMIK